MFKKEITKRAYRQLFCYDGKLTPDGKRVLADLYKYVKMFETGIVDKDQLLFLAGGRDVIEHIIKMLKLTDSETTRRLETELSIDE